jgi:excisionase family DNA binding protein
MEERHLSLSEVAELMEVAERTVRRWIKAGRLKAYKPGRDYRIPESAVKDFIERSEAYPKAQAPPFESEQRRQATLENIVALIDSMDDEQLVRFREFLKEERIALGLAQHDNPDSRTIEVQYARAVERLMQATFELIERGYGREETMHSEERSASASGERAQQRDEDAASESG